MVVIHKDKGATMDFRMNEFFVVLSQPEANGVKGKGAVLRARFPKTSFHGPFRNRDAMKSLRSVLTSESSEEFFKALSS